MLYHVAMTVIGLSGYGRSGKDTVADYLVKSCAFQRIAYADALREMAQKLNPIIDAHVFQGGEIELRRYNDILDQIGYHEGKNIPEFREFLQRLGTEAVRGVVGYNTWVDIAVRRMTEQGGDWVVTDVRFPNEAEAIREMGGGSVWRITRPGFGPANNHPSETSLDGYDFDLMILNDTDIPGLEQKAWDGLQGLR